MTKSIFSTTVTTQTGGESGQQNKVLCNILCNINSINGINNYHTFRTFGNKISILLKTT